MYVCTALHCTYVCMVPMLIETTCVFCFSSAKLHTLMHAMSPAILRVGGSAADWLFFDKPQSVLQAAGLRPKATVATSM